MTKEIWLNLPVKDVQRSKAFFLAIGFSFNEPRSTGDDMACMLAGEKNFVVMLVREAMFAGFSKNNLTDTSQSSEILISYDAETREEVDAIAKKVVAAGGIMFADPGENQGWMYGCGFSDLDGHRWNILYMDFSKMPK